jgi:hypothetical protein
VAGQVTIEEIGDPGNGKDNQGQGKVATNNGDEKRRYQKEPQQAQCVREIHLFLR